MNLLATISFAHATVAALILFSAGIALTIIGTAVYLIWSRRQQARYDKTLSDARKYVSALPDGIGQK